MNRTRRLRLVLCTLLCFVLCSCQTVLPANEKAQVEELLRAPKLSGDYGALQTALNDWLGESAQLKYPIQGELLSPFVLQDLDGDGQQDAAVLYTTAQTANVCVAILQRDDTGSWQVRQSVEGLAETVENVSLAQLQDTDSCQLVVGYTAAQNDHYLAVYSYQKGTLSTILEQQYEQYLVENITGGSSQDLILMSTQEDGSVQIELLTADREGSFRQVAVNGLSADKFSGCASVAAGAGADGRHYLVLDGWTGISGNNLASVLLCYDETSQQMVPATRISSQRLYNASLRNVPTLVSRDLDGDGIVEIPTQPGQENRIMPVARRGVHDCVPGEDDTADPVMSAGHGAAEQGTFHDRVVQKLCLYDNSFMKFRCGKNDRLFFGRACVRKRHKTFCVFPHAGINHRRWHEDD